MKRLAGPAILALAIVAGGASPSGAHNEFVVHHGMAGYSVDIVDRYFYGPTEKADIQQGVIDEDSGVRSLGHFYNPKLNSAPDFSLGSGASPNNAIDRWNSAIAAFEASNYTGVDAAFHMVGRAMHLMQDATSPPHVHDDAHVPPDGSDFEDWGPDHWAGYDFSGLEPRFAAVRTPDGYVKEAAHFTYDLTSYQVVIDEQAGAQVSSEYQQMFPSLVFIDGGIFGDDRWEVDKVGCYGCVLGDDWWIDEFGASSDNGGRGGTARESGTAYIESTGGGTGDGDPRPQVWNGIDNSVAQKTLRQLYGDAVYPEAVRWGAGMLIDFMTSRLDLSCGNGTLDFGEECDDGNTAEGDCCSALCEYESADVVCRDSAGDCDTAETCTGGSGSCPADGFASAATVCRAAVDVCDAEETCTGSSATCPADGALPAETLCREAVDTCDVAETCDGISTACPSDAYAPAATECRPSLGPCDVAETCNGSTTDCPNDGFAASSLVCRESIGPCDTEERCSGSSAACPGDGFAGASVTCRPAAGDCDVAETCDGSGADCPENGFADTSLVCRTGAGPCDSEETCDGLQAACPGDAFASAAVVCREADGDCDVAENCSGDAAACPEDQAAAAGTPCREAADVCDLAEACDGESTDCPADGLAEAGTSCRAAMGDCDAPETCTGEAAACPEDGAASAGTPCSDEGDPCTDDVCDAGGLCTHEVNYETCPTTTTTSTTTTTTTTLPTPIIQNRDQQHCILALNKDARKIAKTQSREIGGCMKGAARGDDDLEGCMTADLRGRLARTFEKTASDEAKKCADAPDFGAAASSIVNAGASGEIVELAHDFLGQPIDGSVDAAAEARLECQTSVLAAIERVMDARIESFAACKKDGLKNASIRTFLDLADCLDATTATADRKVDAAADKFTGVVIGNCTGVAAALAFPARCAGASSGSLAACLLRALDCRFCRLLSTVDGLAADCDLRDDGSVNGSCPTD